ncbi:MFS transporter, DHA1 family, bicyclomycin/chloramphenicol resistance protein [Nocardioides sp. YR527]|nr:MFS transporter, DHA1 family, bicyclomycin/chloramphenicol resistance protein [Nocardioides sp. YR527]
MGPWTVDAYLPAFPEMATDLRASPAQIQLTLTSALVGLGAGQLLLGPLSDSLGRKRPLLLGILLHIGASIAAAMAPSTEVLVGLRFVQGVGSAAAAVIAMAIVRDLYDGARLAATLSRLMLITGVAPTVAPSFGAQLLQVADWRGIFLGLAGIGTLVFGVAALLIPETLPPTQRTPFRARTVTRTYHQQLANTRFVRYVGIVAGCATLMFIYIAGSPFVLQEQFGASQRAYGWIFGGGAVVLTVTPQLTPLMLRHYRPTTLLLVLLPGTVCASAALLVTAYFDLLEVELAVVLIWTMLGIVGCATPIATALALTQVHSGAGSAAAVLGAARFVLAASCAPLVGLMTLFLNAAAAMGLVMVVLSVLSCIVLWAGTRHDR